jgi:hypothetical protein
MTKRTKEYRAEYMQKYIAKKKEELWYKYLRSKTEKAKDYYNKNRKVCQKKALEYYYENKEEILKKYKEEKLLYIGKKAKILREIDKY